MRENPQRLLVVVPSLSGGGAERVVTHLLKGLDRSRFEPHLLLLNAQGPFLGDVPADVTVHACHYVRVRQAIWHILTLVRRLRPDVVFSPIGYLNLLLLGLSFAFPRRTRVVIREANSPSAAIKTTHSPTLFRQLYKRLYARAGQVICQSEGIAEDLIKNFGVPRRLIAILPNPVDLQGIRSALVGKANPYRDAGRRHLLAAGRLTRQKGFDLLIRAVRIWQDAGVPVAVTILGEGQERAALTSLAAELGVGDRVAFKGFQADPYPYYAFADLFVLPSRWEGMPNVALEALACETPVVAFDCPGAIRDVVVHGVNGWLVPPEDLAALAQTVVTHLEAKAQLVRPLLPSQYEIHAAVRRYEDVFLAC